MEKIFPFSDLNLRCGLTDQEYLKIFMDPSVSGINWDTLKQEVSVQMRDRTHSVTLQEYRDERVVIDFMKQIEGDSHAT